MLFEPGGDRQDVRVEDDVGRIEIELLGQQLVGPRADLHLARDRVGLAGFVERHHDHAGAVLLDAARLLQEILFAFLQADGIDDGLALHALQSGLEHRPLRAVDHDRQARDFRLGGDEVEEMRHRLLGVEQAFVHVDVDQVRAAAHLIERHVDGLAELAVLDQPLKFLRAGDVGALADHLEVAVGADRQHFEPGELRVRRLERRPAVRRRDLARRHAGDLFRDRADVIGRRPAAAADDVDEAAGGEIPDQLAGLRRVLVVLAERVRQPCIGIAADERRRDARELGEVRPHLAGAERAVDADGERLRVHHRDPERVDRLPGQASVRCDR